MLGWIKKFKIYAIVGVLIITLFGSLMTYTLHLKGENSLLEEAVNSMITELDLAEQEKDRLRQDLVDLDRLISERNTLHSGIEQEGRRRRKNLDELKVTNEDIKEYLNDNVPEPIVNSLQQW